MSGTGWASCASFLGYAFALCNAIFIYFSGFALGMSSRGGRENEPFMFFDMPGSMVPFAVFLAAPGALAFGAANRMVGAPWWVVCLTSLAYFAAGFGWIYLASRMA